MTDLVSTPLLIEIAAVAFAVAYLVLAIRQNVLCWPAALVSVALSLVLFFDARLYMQAVLQVFYFGMGIYGWYEWKRGGRDSEGVEIGWWSPHEHVTALGIIAVAGLGLGWSLAATDAAYPYADSLTSVAAVVTTYMVARKVMENWIYWFVIDAVSVYLYAARGLVLYALLFVLYLVLVVVGFRTWLRDSRARAVT